MTLVVASLCSDYAVQVSDRRLTFSDGSISDDESNKLFIFASEYCRLAVGYCGFAGFRDIRHFQTKTWLPKVLRDCAPPDFIPARFIERLSTAATRKLQEPIFKAVSPSARRLTIVLNGFLASVTGISVPAWAAVTNYQNFASGSDSDEAWPEFLFYLFEPVVPLAQIASVQRFGFWNAMPPQRLEPLIELLKHKKPVHAVVGKTLELIREVAADPQNLGLVGHQLMSAVISAHATEPARFEYHSDVENFTMYTPTIVSSFRDQGGMIISAELTAVGADAAPLFRKKQPRNAKCGCGSSLKFKRCHGK